MFDLLNRGSRGVAEVVVALLPLSRLPVTVEASISNFFSSFFS